MKELLKDYDKKKVDVFINYLSDLEKEKDKDGKQKNWWYKNVTKQEFVNIFKKVAKEGLFIDGDTITLNYMKKLIVTYDYHAYQNKIKLAHPETQFDFGIVYKGDEYSFQKESGKVYYKHTISDPFINERENIGAYGVIKNKKGEFLETINIEEINKIKSSSKMPNIWEKWFDRMVLKSVIKRICAIHFKDEVNELEIEDNEQYDLEEQELSKEIIDSINNAKDLNELSKIYNDNNLTVKNKTLFVSTLGVKKNEINKKTEINNICDVKDIEKFIKYLTDEKLDYLKMTDTEIKDKFENYDILEMNT